MTAETILFIVIAGLIALMLSAYMYGYKSKLAPKLRWVLGILRGLALFAIGLLLVNPKMTTTTVTTVKPKLPVIVDVSESIAQLKRDSLVTAWVESLMNDSELNQRFDLNFYTQGTRFAKLDSLNFTATNSNQDEALKQVNSLYKDQVAPTIFITDGNQTLGSDYQIGARTFKNPIFPIAIGDTVQYADLRVERLNSNRYAFLNNEFPVEVTLVYQGEGNQSADFTINSSAGVVHRERIQFTAQDNARTLTVNLKATEVGVQTLRAQLTPLENERNTINNVKNFAVEVIDQATNVLIVSNIVHPDIGALKQAITSLEQRKVSVVKPQEATAILNDYQLIILYQPTALFTPVFEALETLGKNRWILTGLETDWEFLNQIQPFYAKDNAGGVEDVGALTNRNYTVFALDDVDFTGFPPLQAQFGIMEVGVPYNEVLSQTISNITTGDPLFFTFENTGIREAVWDGQDLWRWRANTYLERGNFLPFDNFIGNVVQYLSSNKRRSRLTVNNESFYYNNGAVSVDAQYFNENFVFDPAATLEIAVTNKETQATQRFPMLLKGNFYRVDLNSLAAGSYDYTVAVANQGISRSGTFSILDFSTEQQFVNANVTKLDLISQITAGSLFYENQQEALKESLLTDNRFRPIQKSNQKIVPLIDWKYLLACIVLFLAAEWFIRKYNGLI